MPENATWDIPLRHLTATKRQNKPTFDEQNIYSPRETYTHTLSPPNLPHYSYINDNSQRALLAHNLNRAYSSFVMTEAQTISLPQILVILVVGFLIARWIFASSAPAAPGTRNIATAHGSRVNPAHVEQLMSMFPQLERRTVIWELQRNGGNVNRIAETVLGGGRLSVVSTTMQAP